jgi:hypothetical protein
MRNVRNTYLKSENLIGFCYVEFKCKRNYICSLLVSPTGHVMGSFVFRHLVSQKVCVINYICYCLLFHALQILRIFVRVDVYFNCFEP